jgi:hypothetical protein
MSEKMEQDLDRLLADMAATSAAEAAAPPDMGGLMARILADAAREQPQVPRPAAARPTLSSDPGVGAFAPSGGGWLGALAGVFGGRGALAGLMLATVSGLYVGIAQPISLTALGAETPLASLDLLSGSDSLWTETTP